MYIDHLLDFLSCVTHCFLRIRNVYPGECFETRSFLGLSVFQSCHPDINFYIKRVIENCRSLLKSNLLDRYVIIIKDEIGNVLQHFSVSLKLDSIKFFHPDSSLLLKMEDEFRSILSRILLIDSDSTALPKECTWAIMTVVNNISYHLPENTETLKNALTSGEWYVDNKEDTKIPKPNLQQNETTEEHRIRNSRIIPLKSFHYEAISLAVYMNVFKNPWNPS